MKNWLRRALTALTALVVLATASSSGRVGAQAGPSTAWQIGDVFVGISYAPEIDTWGVYRVLTPSGALKNEPDLIDTVGQSWTTGCAVDPVTGDLHTTAFDSMTMSQFDGAGAGHPLEGSINVAALTPAAGVDPLPIVANMAIESVVFDRAGDMFLGAQQLPASQSSWLGHAWILKVSKAGVLKGWWQVDAGDEQNPSHLQSISEGLHGVDWLDLSKDETTIYYTSEDTFIRSFRVAGPNAGTQGPAVSIRGTEGQIGGRAFALRILPPGDPANGFLVATSAAVYRVAQDGTIVQGYSDLSATGYFALNITPDGKSFWTSTFDGLIYKFHIASFQGFDQGGTLIAPGSMTGPFSTGAPGANGICVKREYTAVENACFETDLAGNAVSNGAGGFVTKTCTLPPTPGYCGAHPNDPECVTPGTPTLTLSDQLGSEGVAMDPFQIQATDPTGLGLTWTVTGLPPGLSSVNGLVTGTIQPNASAGANTSRVVDGVVRPAFNVQVTVRNASGQLATGTFAWIIVSTQNSPPTLDPAADRGVTVGFPFAPAIQLHAADADGNTLFLSATTLMPDGITTISGLPSGMKLPRDEFNREAVLCSKASAGGCAIVLTGRPDMAVSCSTALPCSLTFRITVHAIDLDGDWHVADPVQEAALVSEHTKTTSFNVTIGNQIPSFTAANQLAAQGTPVAPAYSGLKDTAADPDDTENGNVVNHRPLTFTVVGGSLPSGLTLASDGVISGTPTQYGPFTITVRGADQYSAYRDNTFTWDVIQKPADQATLVNTATSYQLPALPNGHAATYTVTGLPSGLSCISSCLTTGLITGTPTIPTTAPITVSVGILDTVSGLSASTSFRWTINAHPTLAVVDQTTLIDTTAVPYQPVATSPNGNPLSFAISGLPTGLGFNASGLITGTPTVAVNNALVTVTVTDTVNLLFTTKTFTWTVNAPPAVTVVNQATVINTAATYAIGATSPNGNALSYSITGLPVGLTANAGGVISGTPTVAVTNKLVTVTVTDTVNLLFTTKTFTWTVNAPPDVTVVNQTTVIGVPATYAIVATSPNGNALSYSITGLPVGLTANASGVISGTPTVAVTNALVTVTVTDTVNLLFTTTTFTWTVNAPPVFAVAHQSTVINVPATYAIGATSPNGNPLTYTVTGLPTGLAVDASGVIGGTPTVAVNNALVTVTVTDTVNLLFTTKTFTWTVNAPPDVTVVNQTTVIGVPATYAIVATSPNGNALSYSVTGLPTGLTANASGVISGTPTVAVTNKSVTVTVTDTVNLLFTTTTFTWTVNAPPVFTVAHQSTAINTPATYAIGATSPNGNPLTYTVTGLPTGLAVDGSGVISGTPTVAVTDALVTVTVTDTVNLLFTTKTFTWTVNAPPTLTVANQTTLINTPAVPYQPTAASSNGNPITIVITGLPTGLTAAADGTITGTPTVAVNNAVVTVVVTDTVNGLSTTKTFTWTVNAPPVFTVAHQATVINVPATYAIGATSPNGNPLAYTITGLPAGLTADASGVIGGTPTVAVTDALVTVTVTDTVNGLFTTKTFTWTVNAPPTLTVANQTTIINTPAVPYQPSYASSNGNPTGIAISGLPTGLTASANGTITGTPTVAGIFTVGVTVTDTVNLLFTTRTFTWIVSAPPVFTVADRVTLLGTPVNYAIGATSPNGNALGYLITGLPSNLSYDPNTGVITGTPNVPVNFAPVTVTVTDKVTLLFTTKTFLWSIIAPPLLAVADQRTLVNIPASYQVVASSPNLNPLSYAASGLPTGLAISPTTGLITGIPTVPVVDQPVTVTVTDTVTELATSKIFYWSVITNNPPVCAVAGPSRALWPPNHKFVDVTIQGVVDPDGDAVTIKIASIWQDERPQTNGSGNTISDGKGIGTSVASVRAERTGVKATPGDGRIYQIKFTASDGKIGGTCSGSVLVGIPHDQGGSSMPIDSNIRYDSITGVRIY